MKATNVDELLLQFGDPGRYQIAVYCMIWLAMCAPAFNNYLVLYIASYYPHHCKLPEGWNWAINESIPLNKEGELEECLMYKNPANRSEGTTSCLFGWQHNTPGVQWSIVQEWDLVCSHRNLGAASISLYYGGVMVGCMVFGFLSDKIGRKLVLLPCLYLHIILAVVISYSTSFTMYIALRMIHGAVLQGVVGTAIIMSVEIFQPRRRNVIAVGNQTIWSLILFVVTTFSYFVGHWRTLHLIGGLPAVFTIVYIWLLPESVRWLLVFMKLPQAQDNLRKIARFNKMPVPKDLEEQIKSVAANIVAAKKCTKGKNSEIRELFKTRKIRQILFSGCFIWFAASLTSWGISYSMPKFGESTHINFFISSAIEFTLKLCLMYFILERFGRRNVIITLMTICAILNALAAILRITLPTHESWANIILGFTAVGGRVSLSLFYGCMPMYFRELYPTNVRTMANGVVQIVARPAAMISPYVRILEEDVWKPLPFILYAVFCIGNIIVAYFLPETLNKPLPEIPEDLEKLWESKGSGPKCHYSSVKSLTETSAQKDENLVSEKTKLSVAGVTED